MRLLDGHLVRVPLEAVQRRQPSGRRAPLYIKVFDKSTFDSKVSCEKLKEMIKMGIQRIGQGKDASSYNGRNGLGLKTFHDCYFYRKWYFRSSRKSCQNIQKDFPCWITVSSLMTQFSDPLTFYQDSGGRSHCPRSSTYISLSNQITVHSKPSSISSSSTERVHKISFCHSLEIKTCKIFKSNIQNNEKII